MLNFCYDFIGSYVPAFIVLGVIMFVVVILLQYVITAGQRERIRVEKEESALCCE